MVTSIQLYCKRQPKGARPRPKNLWRPSAKAQPALILSASSVSPFPGRRDQREVPLKHISLIRIGDRAYQQGRTGRPRMRRALRGRCATSDRARQGGGEARRQPKPALCTAPIAMRKKYPSLRANECEFESNSRLSRSYKRSSKTADRIQASPFSASTGNTPCLARTAPAAQLAGPGRSSR